MVSTELCMPVGHVGTKNVPTLPDLCFAPYVLFELIAYLIAALVCPALSPRLNTGDIRGIRGRIVGVWYLFLSDVGRRYIAIETQGQGSFIVFFHGISSSVVLAKVM